MFSRFHQAFLQPSETDPSVLPRDATGPANSHRRRSLWHDDGAPHASRFAPCKVARMHWCDQHILARGIFDNKRQTKNREVSIIKRFHSLFPFKPDIIATHFQQVSSFWGNDIDECCSNKSVRGEFLVSTNLQLTVTFAPVEPMELLELLEEHSPKLPISSSSASTRKSLSTEKMHKNAILYTYISAMVLQLG